MSNFSKPYNCVSKTLLQSALIAAFSIAAFAPVSSMAQSQPQEAQIDPGHWFDYKGTGARDTEGYCVRSSEWRPGHPNPQCDPMPKAAEIPAPVIVAEAPPAPVVVAPQRMETRKISFLAEDLFDFDKSALKPAGKRALDNLAIELNGVAHETIIVTGHTDRIGRKAYNQKLSERRAAAVDAYLVDKGIPQNLMTSKGMGETDPVTKRDDCRGPVSKKLIACLQPDRRVEIEVTGSKEVAMSGPAVSNEANDSAIAANVKADLLNQPANASRVISVESYQGTVQLNGFVSSQDESNKAAEIARNVKGVSSVNNNLEIK